MPDAFLQSVIEQRELEQRGQQKEPARRAKPKPDDRFCAQGCGSRLRPHNVRGICRSCSRKGEHGRGLIEFRRLATALGHNPEEILYTFARRWVDRVKAGLKVPSDDDDA